MFVSYTPNLEWNLFLRNKILFISHETKSGFLTEGTIEIMIITSFYDHEVLQNDKKRL